MTPRRATLAGVSLGDGLPVAVLGVLNVSPESFHAGSVRATDDDLLQAALAMAEAGAALLDVGARSTAPYLDTDISDAEERDRLARAVEMLARKVPVPVSADTSRPGPARAALEAGARVINDVTGLRDPRVAALVREHGADLILMASPERIGAGGPAETTLAPTRSVTHRRVRSDQPAEATGLRWPPAPDPLSPEAAGLAWPPGPDARPVEATGLGHAADSRTDPVVHVRGLLAAALGRAREAGIPEERIVLDPGIGFFRDEAIPWDEWDVRVLAGLEALGALGRPLCVGISRKSFVGAITGRTRTEARLAGSLAAATVAVLGGAALLRTHDVAETRDAIRIAERIRRATMARAMDSEGADR